METRVASRPVAPVELVERTAHLSELEAWLASVRNDSRGRLVLVGGEAGVGKTALLRRFCDERRGSVRVLWGACDALFTPRPLGPFLDVAEITGGELAELVEGGAKPHEVTSELLRALQLQSPTIMVLEDLHWADEATLDVLRMLGRRIEAAPALVLASYRDDELEAINPFRIVLGELTTSLAVQRLKLQPLSQAAVATLAEPAGVDPDELYRKTTGNPFFVTEALAAVEQGIPDTVRDAVLARTARLSAAARTLVEAVAIAPPQAELWLLEALAEEAGGQLEECLASGMLTEVAGGVAFRHELARLAVENSLSPGRRRALHEQALAALAAPPAGLADLARLAHHAEAAGDAQAVLRYAPAAAERAAALGAHREAAAQYGRVLVFGEQLPAQERAEVLELRAQECLLTDHYDDAIEALEQAIEHYRTLGDQRGEGNALRALAQTLWCPGRTAEAEQTARQAVAVLEQLPPSHELAMAYSSLSAVHKDAENAEEAIAWATRALELADRLDDEETRVYALGTIGAIQFVAGAPEGREKLESVLERAATAGLTERVGWAYMLLVWGAVRIRSHAVSSRYLEEGLEFCSHHGIELYRLYLLAYRAQSLLDQGRWQDAVESAGYVLRIPRSSTTPRIVALSVLGLVRARRGDPGVWDPLDEALALAEPTGELQRIGLVTSARAEAAWLEGRSEAVGSEIDAALKLAVRRRAPWMIGDLACWRRRVGSDEEPPHGAAEPYALQLAGEWTRAAELWTRMGCPYEAALALAEADDEEALRQSLAAMHELAAAPAAAIVARRLRERGARGLPRGPRPTTRKNPGGLTARELEVLLLVAQGLHNSEIAGRLFLAEKTVDHHVSAILRKLGVRSRGQASAEAVRLGLAQDR
jgi:DNA-binding CsgD family transcriptional regulator/tetratricopeptide (TPR) repeat protein